MTATMTLYEIGEQFLALEALLAETGGELTPEIESWFTEYGQLEKNKVDGYVAFLRSQEAYAKDCQAEAEVLARKAQVALNSIRCLKKFALVCLQARNVKELAGTVWKLARQANGGLVAMTFFEPDPVKQIAMMPERFVRMVPQIDTAALRQALEAGDPEAVKVARLEPRGEHVRIR